MANGIRADDSRGLNKESSSKFRVGSRGRKETIEEGQRTYQPKRCEYDNFDNSPKTLKDKNYQTSSQKFRQVNNPH